MKKLLIISMAWLGAGVAVALFVGRTIKLADQHADQIDSMLLNMKIRPAQPGDLTAVDTLGMGVWHILPQPDAHVDFVNREPIVYNGGDEFGVWEPIGHPRHIPYQEMIAKHRAARAAVRTDPYENFDHNG